MPIDLSKLRVPSFTMGSIGSLGEVSLSRATYISFSRIADLKRDGDLRADEIVSDLIQELSTKTDGNRLSATEGRDLTPQDRSRLVSKLIEIHPTWFGLTSDTDSTSSEQEALERTEGESDEEYLARAFRREASRQAKQRKRGVLGIAAGLSENKWASDRLGDVIREQYRMPEIYVPPNPIHETNDILSEVAGHIRQMRELATATAQMQRTLNDTASAAVRDFNAGATASREATVNGLWIAGASLAVSVIALFTTMYFSISQGSESSTREKAASAQAAKLIASENAAKKRTAELIAAERALTETISSLGKELVIARRAQPVDQASSQAAQSKRP